MRNLSLMSHCVGWWIRSTALCNVAAGRLDGYAEKYIGQWDYMAGSLIVMEAGGTVADYDGSADFTQGDSVVATNGLIQQDLLTAILSGV